MSDVPVEHLRAMIRLLGTDEMTPTARRLLEHLCQQYEDGETPPWMTPPLSFTPSENAALLASVAASAQTVAAAERRAGTHPGRAWSTMNSLRTLFAEQAHAFERRRV